MKYLAAITVGLMVIATIVGCIHKSAYTNYTKDSFDSFYVGVLDYGLAENAQNAMKDELEKVSEYIVRVKAVTDLQFVFLRAKQRVEVQEVYKGDGVEVGEEIDVTVDGSHIFFEGDVPMSINLDFVNVMEPNEEYLLFLESKVESDFSYEDGFPYDVYRGSPSIIAPFFSYRERESVPVTPDRGAYRAVPYAEVKDSEYFVTSQEALDCLLVLKATMLERYPRQ